MFGRKSKERELKKEIESLKRDLDFTRHLIDRVVSSNEKGLEEVNKKISMLMKSDGKIRYFSETKELLFSSISNTKREVVYTTIFKDGEEYVIRNLKLVNPKFFFMENGNLYVIDKLDIDSCKKYIIDLQNRTYVNA